MADIISNSLAGFQSQMASAKPATGFGTGWIIGIGLFIGILVVAVVGALIWWHFYSKKQWNILVRVHYENPTINGVSLGSGTMAKRIRFKDGRVVYMYKSPIQGYSISPELLTWTRPREHDVIVTKDKKIFCLNGISSIDAQRKLLNVDVSYPDIEYDRQDLQKFIDSKKFDDPNERFKIIAKAVVWIFIMITIIVVVILGSKTYIDNKALDIQKDNIGLQVSENSLKVMEQVNTFTAILSKVMPESFKAIDGKNLINNGTLSA